ncbi:transposase, partial [Ostertagia ostertagi]
MDCDHATILRHLHSMEYTQKLGSWVPHELTEETKASRLRIAAQNLARHRATHDHRNRFLHRIITGDEKWCLYANVKQRKQWICAGDTPTPRVRQDLHPDEIMLCVWWDWEGIGHWETLEKNQTVDKDLYVAQLRRVNEALQLKRRNREGQ